jgi:hypothetical protein
VPVYSWKKDFYADGHIVSLECAVWYWHFVDVVWLFLYIFLYIWGSKERAFIIPHFDFTERAFSFSGTDFAVDKQITFQDSASVNMDIIVNLHNYIMFYLILILIFVCWLAINIFINNRIKGSVSYLFSSQNLFNKQEFFKEIGIKRDLSSLNKVSGADKKALVSILLSQYSKKKK